MKLFGSLSELVSVVFRKNSQTITLRPNQATTYTAARDIQTPPQDANSVLVSESATQTLTNKTLTAPTVTNPTITDGSITSVNTFSLDDTDSAFDLSIESTSTLPGNRTLTLDTEAGNRTLRLSNDFITAGSQSITLTGTGSTNVTLPTTGTLATLAGTETLSNKTLASPDVTTQVRLLNQGQLQLREGTGGGTDQINIQAPSTLAASYTLTLPPDDGSSGQFLTTDGSGVLTWSTSAGATDSQADAKNYSIACSVGSSALTIALKNKAGSDPSGGDAVSISFRNATAATGDYVLRSVTAATSITVTSGATLGQRNAEDGYIYVYALDNAGTVELAVSTYLVPEHSIQSTTVMNSSSDDNYTFYSTTARTTKSVRLLARLTNNQTTAGTYSVVPTNITLGTYFIPFRTKDMSLTVTGNNSWTTSGAFGYAYEDGGGTWRLAATVRGTTSSTTQPDITFSGVTFTSGYQQTCAVNTNNLFSGAFAGCQVDVGTGVISLFASSASVGWNIAALDLKLDKRPTWA